MSHYHACPSPLHEGCRCEPCPGCGATGAWGWDDGEEPVEAGTPCDDCTARAEALAEEAEAERAYQQELAEQ